MRKLDAVESWGADKLEAKLEAARDELRGLDRNIRKILGRDLPDGENGPNQQTPRNVQKRPLQREDRRRVVSDFPNPDSKKRWPGATAAEPKTAFSRLSARITYNADDSADEDEGSKPAVSSRVIATPREVPSRQEVIRRERVDERSRQRNKRMFGALLGTLQKFRQEETKLKAKEDKKAEVEARVEEAKRKEKEELKKERQQLFLSRKRQMAEVRALEVKVARSRQFHEWRAAHAPLANFIRTRSQPGIYYLPKKMNERSIALLEETSKELNEKIEAKEKTLLQELEIMEAQVGLGKSQNYENVVVAVEPIEESQAVEEGEENRDPNPEVEPHEVASLVEDARMDEERIEKVIDEVFKEEAAEENNVQEDETNG